MVPASIHDIPFLAANAREADAAELMAVCGMTPEEAMTQGLENSIQAWTGLIDGVPCCMFGVARVDWSNEMGACWMTGTDLIDRHPLVFLRGSRVAFGEMLKLFPALCNYVDSRHSKAIQWLRWLGAEIREPQAYGLAGLPFHFFKIRG